MERYQGYYGTKLSPNRIELGNGAWSYLNVPIARTGTQEYGPGEIPGSQKAIAVIRDPTEVFSPETIASFEAAPVTDEHPTRMVDESNIAGLAKGMVTKVRRGQGDEADLLLADIVVQDPLLNQQIQNGKREISSGYYYALEEINGQYYQREIRGNHVAVVRAGRAGPRVAIKDAKPKTERKKTMKGNIVSRFLGIAAKDADPEEVAAMIDELTKEPEAAPAAAPAAAPTQEPAKDEGVTLDQVLAAIKELAAAIKNPAAPATDSELDKLESEIGAKDEDPEKKEEKPAEEAKDASIGRDSAMQLLKAMRPVIEGIKDEAQRKAATDALAGYLRKSVAKDGGDGYAQVAAAAAAKAVAMDDKPKDEVDVNSLGDAWAKKYNPQYKDKE